MCVPARVIFFGLIKETTEWLWFINKACNKSMNCFRGKNSGQLTKSSRLVSTLTAMEKYAHSQQQWEMIMN